MRALRTLIRPLPITIIQTGHRSGNMSFGGHIGKREIIGRIRGEMAAWTIVISTPFGVVRRRAITASVAMDVVTIA